MEDQAKKIRPDKVAMYIRWSTDEQSDGTTLVEQREGCEFYIRSQGWFVNPTLIFTDDGYSGATLDRPGMRQLRDLVRKGDVDCTVVLKIDRLSRNIVDATQLVLDEWNGKCHLRCVRQPIDTTSETGRMFFSILATFADFERAQITERTYQGRLRRIAEGKGYGGRNPPYAFVATGQPGVWTVDPVRGPAVAELFRRVREERATPRQLQVWLEENHIPPPESNMWSLTTLRSILRNPIYAGRIVYGRAAHIKKEGRKTLYPMKRDKPLIEVQAATVPAIVSPEVFDDVQAILADRTAFHKEHRQAATATHLLTGIARCKCGGPINIHWANGKRFYRCSRQITRGPQGCTADSGTMLADPIDEAVLQDLLSSFGHHRQRTRAAQAVGAHGSREANGLERDKARLAAELNRVDQRIAELRTAAGMGDLSLSEWRVLTDAMEAKRTDTQTKLSEVETKLKRIALGHSQDRMVVERMQLLDRWADLGPIDQKELLRDLAETIELYKPRGQQKEKEIRVVWRFV